MANVDQYRVKRMHGDVSDIADILRSTSHEKKGFVISRTSLERISEAAIYFAKQFLSREQDSAQQEVDLERSVDRAALAEAQLAASNAALVESRADMEAFRVEHDALVEENARLVEKNTTLTDKTKTYESAIVTYEKLANAGSDLCDTLDTMSPVDIFVPWQDALQEFEKQYDDRPAYILDD